MSGIANKINATKRRRKKTAIYQNQGGRCGHCRRHHTPQQLHIIPRNPDSTSTAIPDLTLVCALCRDTRPRSSTRPSQPDRSPLTISD